MVISPSEINAHLRTIIISPVTNRGREWYPTRIKVTIDEVNGWIVLDQIRSIDKTRLCDKIGNLNSEDILDVKSIIKEMLVD